MAVAVDCDVVVVGGGPAGLTAAGWLGRYRRQVLVVDGGDYRNASADWVHGLYANDPADPETLRLRAHQDLEQYDHVDVVRARVGQARTLGDDLFEVTVAGDTLRTRRVVLATGVRDVFPHVARFAEFYGADVFHCPACDGHQARGRAIAVFGWQAHVSGFAMELLDWADTVHIVTNGRPLEVGDQELRSLGSHGIDVVEARAVELIGERGRLEGVRLDTGQRVPCAMAFFSIDHEPATGLAVQLGCDLDDDGYVRVNRAACTSVAGVYAAGDLTGGIQLVGMAVGEGTAAGVACAQSLYGRPSLPGVPAPAPPPDEAVPPQAD